jgi:hypothetical protein
MIFIASFRIKSAQFVMKFGSKSVFEELWWFMPRARKTRDVLTKVNLRPMN